MKMRPDDNFFKGLMLAVPLGLFLWALIIYGIMALL